MYQVPAGQTSDLAVFIALILEIEKIGFAEKFIFFPVAVRVGGITSRLILEVPVVEPSKEIRTFEAFFKTNLYIGRFIR